VSRKSAVPTSADGSLLPVYLLDGAEEFLIEETLRELLEAAVPEEARGFNVDSFDGGDADMKQVLAVASSYPMMSDRRAVVVRNVDKLGKEDTDLLAGYVERPMNSTVLALTSQKADARRKMVKTIAASGGTIPCKPLNDSELPGWIARRAARKKIEIDGESCTLLASMIGKSLRELDMELDKLILYVGRRNSIGENDIRTVVGVSKQYNVFELQRAIANRNLPKALEIMTKLVESGQGAPVLTAVLTTFFSTIWRMYEWKRRGLSRDQMCVELKYPPNSGWRLADHETAMRRFRQTDIDRAMAGLMVVDERSKGGGEELALLTTFMVDVVGGTPGQAEIE
jgi:DNA polymerase-3 subunit delta